MSSAVMKLLILVSLIGISTLAVPQPQRRFKRNSTGDLVDAIRRENQPEAIRLIENGVNLNVKDLLYDRLPIHYASEKGFDRIVDLLIKKGSLIDSKDIDENTPLHIASTYGHVDVVKLLLQNGSEMTVRNEYGSTPLHKAARQGRASVTELLLRKGSDTQSVNNDENTPLHEAAWGNRLNTVKILLDFGADRQAKNKRGKTPRGIAFDKGFADVVHLLDQKVSIQTSRVDSLLKACERYSAYPEEYILNGDPAKSEEFPWTVALGYDGFNDIGFKCGGTLISEFFILTTAHCTKPDHEPIVIRLGKLNLTDPDARNYHIEKIIRHKHYSRRTNENDIALIKLREEVVPSYVVRPACLYTNLNDLHSDVRLFVTGWGSTLPEKNEPSDVLRKAELKTVPRAQCNEEYRSYDPQATHVTYINGVRESQYCAEDLTGEGRGSCHGDSGSPLQFFPNNSNTAHIIGIVSVGIGCGALPTIHTRVAYYADWIAAHVWPNGFETTS